jgi:hypothetical protein
VATNYPAPDESAIETLLTDLAAVPTRVVRSPAPDPESDATGVFAEFVTDDNQLAVLAYADSRVANCVGGALVDLTAQQIAEANDKLTVHDASLEGVREVLNIMSSCLNSEFTKHLRLGDVHNLPGQLTDDVKHLWRQPRGRRAYEVTVEDFGTGALILYLG